MRRIPLTVDSLIPSNLGEDVLINLYPQPVQSQKGQFRLIHTPGLRQIGLLDSGPVLGMYEINGRAYVVTTTKIYQMIGDVFIDITGASPLELSINLSRQVSIAGSELYIVIVDGVKGYALDILNNSVTELTNLPGFYGATTVTFQDGYFIFNRQSTGQFFISRLNDIIFDPLDFITAEGHGDYVTAVISNKRELYVFGRKTISVWYHSGSRSIFSKNLGVFIERGCIMPHTIKKIDNTVFFLGDDLVVYKMIGYTPVRVSTPFVERYLSFLGIQNGESSAYVYSDEGSNFYVINIYDGSHITLVYDISTGIWHRRKSPGRRDHVVRSVMRDAWGRLIAGSIYGPNIWEMSRAEYTESPPSDGVSGAIIPDDISRVFVMPVTGNNREYMHISLLELDATLRPGESVTYTLEVSRDSRRYGLPRVKEIAINDFKERIKWARLGTAREFMMRITVIAEKDIDIGGVYIA